MTGRDARQRVLEAVEGLRGEIAALARDLVRIPSVTPGFPGADPEPYRGMESAVSRRLRDACGDRFDDLDLFEGVPGRENLAATLRGSGGGPALLFNGHVDVVPPGDPDQWTGRDPFGGRIEGGRLHGRGACDMKAGLAALFLAARALREAGVRLRGDLTVVAVCGEEMGQRDAGIGAALARGYRADGAVVAEPSGPPDSPAINPASTGLLTLRVIVPGRSGHASARREFLDGAAPAANAVEKAVLVIRALQDLERAWVAERRHPLFPPGRFTLHPGIIDGRARGAESPVMVADECRIGYLIAYPPGADVDALMVEIERHVAAAVRTDPWLAAHPPRLEWRMHWPPYSTPLDHPLVRAVARAHEGATGRAAPLAGLACVCDATFLEAAGIPTINYGPGDLTVAHAPDEHVEIEDAVVAAKVYALAAIEWCGVGRA